MKTLFVILVAAGMAFGQAATPTPKPTPAPRPHPTRPTPPTAAPPPSDVQTWIAAAKAAGGVRYHVRCFGTRCQATVMFSDHSSLRGQGTTRQAAMAAVNFKAAHLTPTATTQQDWQGSLQ
jgi:hypothetical protein